MTAVPPTCRQQLILSTITNEAELSKPVTKHKTFAPPLTTHIMPLHKRKCMQSTTHIKWNEARKPLEYRTRLHHDGMKRHNVLQVMVAKNCFPCYLPPVPQPRTRKLWHPDHNPCKKKEKTLVFRQGHKPILLGILYLNQKMLTAILLQCSL